MTTSTSSFLLLGFVVGIRHALDADHVAAVVSLATRGGTIAGQARQGALWGLGHASTLLLVGGACVLLGVAVPREAERWLEAAVGAMLVLLGASVFLRLRRTRIHVEAHSHARVPAQALLVGAVHGLAGSGALVLLVAQTAETPAIGLVGIASFGLGSILGMMSLAAAIAWPLNATAPLRGRLHQVLCGGAGAFSLLLGARMIRDFAA
jgi:hypothetical protein